jgi:peroxiredoxin
MAMREQTVTRLLVAGLVLVLLAAGGCKPLTSPPPAAAEPPAVQPTAQDGNVGKKAPDFSVTDVEGKAHSLKDYAGKILVVDFWATYCKPCVEHLRDYNDAAYEMSKQGVEFLGLSMDDSDAAIKGWRPEGFAITLARLDEKTHKAFFGDTAVVAIPQVRIIDRKGILRYSLGPDATAAQVKDAIKTLLDEK